MEHASKSPSDQQREGAARRHPAATIVDNRPATITQRELADAIRDSARASAQQASLGLAFSPRVIAQRRQFERMFGSATRQAAPGVVQRITMKEAQEELPERYKKLLVEWVRARTLPTAERPEKYKEGTTAVTHFFAQVPSVAILQQILDAYRANKKADAEHNEETLRMLTEMAVKTISSFKLLKDNGAGIGEIDLAKAVRILDDAAFFKAHVAVSVEKLKHHDPYEVTVAVGARLNEETKAFAEKGVAYFKSSVDFSTVVHEMLHLLCRTPVKNLLGHLLNEGITELLTQWTCAGENAAYVEDYAEEKNLTTVAFKMVGKLQKGFLASTYFSDPKEMAILLETKMGKEKFAQFKSMSDADQALELLTT